MRTCQRRKLHGLTFDLPASALQELEHRRPMTFVMGQVS